MADCRMDAERTAFSTKTGGKIALETSEATEAKQHKDDRPKKKPASYLQVIQRELARVMADEQTAPLVFTTADLVVRPNRPLRVLETNEKLLARVNAAFSRLLAAEEAAGIPPFESTL
ncbi:hypothetical protein M3Y99_00255500 [Aphelenchoides fujianensis]|nr:hypothetical protein M3Y99_00255500 [Aphelenchoides fujianensis]